MFHHVGNKAKAVVRFAEAFVVTTMQDEADRFGVAIGGEEVAISVEGHAKRIHLAVTDVFDARAIKAHAEDIARLHVDGVPVLARHR